MDTVAIQKRYMVMPSMDRPALSARDASDGVIVNMAENFLKDYGPR